MLRPCFIILFVLLISHSGHGRSFSKRSNLISNGVDHTSRSPIREGNVASTTVTCEPVYGFLPCTGTVWGQLFMIIVYEYLLSLAEKYVSSGSDLFFQMFGTGIFGASLFHILGTIPQVVMVLVLGVTETTDAIESLATMVMGLLAGSTIMLLTLVWGSVVAFGSYDLSLSSANSSDVENERPFSFTGHGVHTDVETYYTARIMFVSMIPFLILQLAAILNSSSGARIVAFVALVVSVCFLFVYSTYQVFQPWIQSRRLDYVMRNFVQNNSVANLLTFGGKPDVNLIRELFQKLDHNNDNLISASELRALILGITIDSGLKEDDYEAKVLEQFEISGDSSISDAEFVKGISNWISSSGNSDNNQDDETLKFFNRKSKKTTEEQQGLLAQKTTEEQQGEVARKKERKRTDKPWLNYSKAAFLLLLGTGMTTLLAMPLMDTLQDFSTSVNLSSFAVSYVVIPLALNYREALGAITSAQQKTNKAISLTFSEIYNGVFMNNLMGLASFLALVCIRDLSWNVSAGVLVVLLICTGMGLLTSFRTRFPFWTSIVACLLYPLSLLLLYILTTVFGWS